jgi:hypothetical protein
MHNAKCQGQRRYSTFCIQHFAFPVTDVSHRRILHIDMDAFYASVEQRDDPKLRGKPLAVGGQPNRRGVVAAASYEAREFGVRSAMSMAKAVRLCPSLVIVPPDFNRYRIASNAVFSIFREVTNLIEPLSLDEAYLDVTDNRWHEPIATMVARRLKERIKTDTGLTASAGVAPNKFLAKIASDEKPELTVISPSALPPSGFPSMVVGVGLHRPQTAGTRHHSAGRRTDHRSRGASEHRRKPCRLAAPAVPGYRPPAGRARSGSEVVWNREHISVGSD